MESYRFLAAFILGLVVSTASAKIYDFKCGNFQIDGKTKGVDTLYTKGEPMFLCIHFLPFGVQLPFRMIVDDFGLIEVKECIPDGLTP